MICYAEFILKLPWPQKVIMSKKHSKLSNLPTTFLSCSYSSLSHLHLCMLVCTCHVTRLVYSACHCVTSYQFLKDQRHVLMFIKYYLSPSFPVRLFSSTGLTWSAYVTVYLLAQQPFFFLLLRKPNMPLFYLAWWDNHCLRTSVRGQTAPCLYS